MVKYYCDIKYFWDKKYKYHVVQIIDEKPDPIIVYKYYGKYKQWWHYEIKRLYEFESYIKAGLYKLKKN